MIDGSSQSTTGGGPSVTYETVSPSGGDDTANIAAAIAAVVTAAQANGSNYGEVWFDATKGPFQAGAATQQNATYKGNAQIPLPIIPEASPKFTLVLRGTRAADALMHWNQAVPTKSGAVIQSTLVGTNDATWGEASVIGGPTPAQGYGTGTSGTGNLFSNMLIVVDGIALLLPNDPHVCGFDFRGVGEARVLSASTLPNVNGPGVNGANITLPTQAWQFGLAMPQDNNNDIADILYYSAEGQNYGLVSSEHTVAHSVRGIYCVAAVEHAGGSTGSQPASTTGHGAIIHYLSAEWCNVAIGSVGSLTASKVCVDLLDYEPGTGSWVEFHRINDPSNHLFGYINHTTNSGGIGTGGVNGGTNLRIIDLQQNPGHAAPPAVPATTVALTNPFWRDAAVTISGGTVSAITVDGTATGIAATGHTVIVPSGKAIALTYTVAPAWNWVLL